MAFDKTFIQTQVGSLQSRKQELQWLIEQHITAKRIANFGCHIGGETLALMWIFNADEATGIDRDKMAINQAQTTLESLQEIVIRTWQEIQYFPDFVTESDKQWWYNDVPDFFKRAIIQSNFRVSYITHDITSPTSLTSDYYDLSYCDFVLHHIWYDEKRSNPQDDTLTAIREMARVIKPNGIVAMSELLQFSDKPKLDFKGLFEQVGLRVIYEKVTDIEEEQRGWFITGKK